MKYLIKILRLKLIFTFICKLLLTLFIILSAIIIYIIYNFFNFLWDFTFISWSSLFYHPDYKIIKNEHKNIFKSIVTTWKDV